MEKLEDLLKDEKTKEEIKEAIRKNRFLVLKKGNREIGFFTYEPYEKKVYLGNLWIDKEFRKVNNLLFLRKLFRDKFNNLKFNWKSRKRGSEVWVS